MAKCLDCKKDMSKSSVVTCDKNIVIVDGKEYPRNTKYHDVNVRCHDCNIVNGFVHHFGCDMERCPKCDGQLISCDCISKEPKLS